MSVFHPDRLALVKGAPAHRRAHLDRLCGALWPARADLRTRFGRTLAQRNALVARVRAGLGSPDSLPSWDERLAEEATPLIEARGEAVEALTDRFAELAGKLGLDEAEISYRPRAAAGGDELAAELARRRAVDLGRAYTSYGPQLDEIEIRLAARPLRRFASQGQQRLALLALLFAEREALLEAGRAAPLMLLDDVMSELDAGHRKLLVSLLEVRRPVGDQRHGDRSRAVGERSAHRGQRRHPVGRAGPEGRLMGRRAPRPIGAALETVLQGAEPATLLAAVQSAWPGAVGEAVAREASPVSERDGVVTVACRSATWAQELDLLGGQILAQVTAEPARMGRFGGLSLHRVRRSVLSFCLYVICRAFVHSRRNFRCFRLVNYVYLCEAPTLLPARTFRAGSRRSRHPLMELKGS